MRPALLPVILIALLLAVPALAATPLTLEVLGDDDTVIETLVIPPDQIDTVESGYSSHGQPVLSIRFGAGVRDKFGDVTKRNLYKRMRMRVGETVLTPGARIMSPIYGGSVQLSGLSPEEMDKVKKQLGR